MTTPAAQAVASGGRIPPHDVPAEESLLGAMLLSRDAIVEAVQVCTAEDFYKPAHGHVFEAVCALYSQGEPADPVTVADELRRADLLDAIGGVATLVSLQVNTPATSNARRYAQIVEEHSRLRRFIQVGNEFIEAGYRRDLGAVETLLGAEREALVAPGRGDKAVTGAAFVLDAPEEVPALWGRDGAVLWAAGETLLLVGPTGVGKTTVAQQQALARTGLRREVLGMPVVADEQRVLYVAADRPSQVARSLRRMVTEEDREMLGDRLVVWPGPLPFDLAQAPADSLLRLARQHGAGTVVLDSLKDLALDLVKDEVGSRLNHVLQVTLAGGVEVLGLHHQRKGQAAAKPKALEDVYGSTWIVAGAGSVVLLWGAAGDPVVELSHLKQPAEEVGPLQVVHDHVSGTTTVHEGNVDLYDVVRSSNGLIAEGAARALFGCESPTASQVEKARRRLEGLVSRGLVQKQEGGRDPSGRQLPGRYYARAREG